MASFDTAFQSVLRFEGGYINDPDDPGGATKYGISHKSYPGVNIENLTVEQAATLYRRDYWEPLRIDLIKAQMVANNIFDFAVNAGAAASIAAARRVVGLSAFGPMSLVDVKKINAMAQDKFNAAFYAQRAAHYNNLAIKNPRLKKFLNGWLSRAKSFVNGLTVKNLLIIGGVSLAAFAAFRYYQSINPTRGLDHDNGSENRPNGDA